jgi:hypothetical protein
MQLRILRELGARIMELRILKDLAWVLNKGGVDIKGVRSGISTDLELRILKGLAARSSKVRTTKEIREDGSLIWRRLNRTCSLSILGQNCKGIIHDE